MHLFLSLLLGLVSLAQCAPQSNPLPPFMSMSLGFRLVVNVSDTRGPGGIYHGRDMHALSLSDNRLIAAIVPRTVSGAVFYLSTRNVTSGARAVMSEFSAGPDHSFSVQTAVANKPLTFAEGPYGHASWAFMKEGFPEFWPGVSLLACTEKMPFGSNDSVEADVDFLKADPGSDDSGCVWVRILAECATLPDVPEGSMAAAYRSTAEEVKCYKSLP